MPAGEQDENRPHDPCPPSNRKYAKFSKSRRLTQYGEFRCRASHRAETRNLFPEIVSQIPVHSSGYTQTPPAVAAEAAGLQRVSQFVVTTNPRTRRDESTMNEAVFARSAGPHRAPHGEVVRHGADTASETNDTAVSSVQAQPWTPRMGSIREVLTQTTPCAHPQRRCSSGVGSEEPRRFRIITSGGRQESTCASFGTNNGKFSSLASLSSSLPAGWPPTRATLRASSSRLFDTPTFFRRDISFGARHSTHSRRARGIWRESPKSSKSAPVDDPRIWDSPRSCDPTMPRSNQAIEET